MALQSIAAAEWSRNQLLRDFQRRSIFDFYDTICHNPTSAASLDHLVGAGEQRRRNV
jgi:hypothetical protein